MKSLHDSRQSLHGPRGRKVAPGASLGVFSLVRRLLFQTVSHPGTHLPATLDEDTVRTSTPPAAWLAIAVLALTCSAPALAQGASEQLGPRVTVASGSDPDVAIDSAGGLHVVYARAGATYYRQVDYPDSVGAEYYVGSGDDPQVAVDSLDRPHVVMGAVRYSRWNGSGFIPPITVANAWRKPRLAIDSQDRVHVTVSRIDSPRVILYVIDDDVVISGPDAVGDDNNGAIDFDGADVAQLTWRSYSVYHNTYTMGGGAGSSQSLHPSSDFSWIAVDRRDDSLHVVNTVRYGEGIHYRAKTAAGWGSTQTVALAEVSGVDDADNVGPTIGADVDGYKVVAFAGRARVPYYFVVGPDNVPGDTFPLDPENGSLSGGKFENPNVGAHPGRPGAFVAWGNGTAYVRSVGPVLPPGAEVLLTVEPAQLSWTRPSAQEAATFDVVRGDLGTLLATAGDFTPATDECLGDDVPETTLAYAVDPAADTGFWFAVRPVAADGTPGSYDAANAPGQAASRDAGIDAAAPACP